MWLGSGVVEVVDAGADLDVIFEVSERWWGSSLLVDEEVEGGRGGGGLLPACLLVTRGCGRVEVVARVRWG